MSTKKGYKTHRTAGIIIGAIIVFSMAVNWFMTYRLEDFLEKHLRSEIIKASDGLYDFSFDKLNVGLFSGELMIEGLALWSDTTALKLLGDSTKLPHLHIDFHIDTIYFQGINLTWRFDYRELSFDQFTVKHPTIKITSSSENMLNEAGPIDNKSIHERLSSYFDVIHSRKTNLSNGEITYVVKDSITSSYTLSNFNFNATNFLLNEDSHKTEHLLFSDNFEFFSNVPQIIYDSEHFIFSVDQLRLSTIDSVLQVKNAYLQTKHKYWTLRKEVPGSYSSFLIGDTKFEGIALTREGAYNFLKAKSLRISNPNIEYYSVEETNRAKPVKKLKEDSISTASWTLYTITSPIFEEIAIHKIDINEAELKYVYTSESLSNSYTLSNFNFHAQGFLVDSLQREYNLIHYINDFSVNSDSVQAKIYTKNVVIDLSRFELSTISKEIQIKDLNLAPISFDPNKDYIEGKIKEIGITNINYDKGFTADLLSIASPEINYIQAKKSLKNKPAINKSNATNEILDIIAPFISSLAVKSIVIDDANASLWFKEGDQKYQINNLNFYAKNFLINEETRRLRDYFFKWDEYNITFNDFDNLTPDKKYRIQIKEGDFNSVTGNVQLTDLKVTPQPSNTSSYFSIISPSVILMSLDEKGIRDKNLSFKTFILDSPIIEIVKEDDIIAKEIEKEVSAIAFSDISFDLLTIPSPSVYYYDKTKGLSAQIQSSQIHVDSFRWNLNENFHIDNMIIESPYISIVEEKESNKDALDLKEESNINISSFGDINIRRININNPILKMKRPNMYLDFSAKKYSMESLYWSHKKNSKLSLSELDFINPTLFWNQTNVEKKSNEPPVITRENIIKAISNYANETKLGKINIANLNLQQNTTKVDGSNTKKKLIDTYLLIENLDTDWNKQELNVDEIAFSTKDIDYPIMDSFYTFRIKDVAFSKREGTLSINDIRLAPNYPKFDFAYIHPTGGDWFDVAVDRVRLIGLDGSRLITDTLLRVKKLEIDHVNLENFKNQKITIEHNIMPLLYEQFQKFPLRYHIEDLDIRDFNVIYEELAKNGNEPARIPFDQMNGRIKDFTNIQKNDSAFYTLYADGLAMSTAPFVAEWTIPVDSTNDVFYLDATIGRVDMRDFNQLIQPMAPAYIRSGIIEKLHFSTRATSLGATIDMQMKYDSLYVVLLRNMKRNEKNRQLTRIINRWGIKSYNQDNNFRAPTIKLERDPYHSNFNYFWQILQPPLIESIGINEEKQNLAHNLITIFNRIKRFFKGKEEKEKNN